MSEGNSIDHGPLSHPFSMSALLRFALPTMIMMVFMGLYTIGDTIFVSRFVNTNALSAMNIVCPIINILVGVGGMIATGGNAIIAKKMGEKDPRANQDLTLLVLCSGLLGGIIAVLGILFIDDILYGLGASEVQFAYGKTYLFIILLSTPACILQVLFQNLIVTAGKPTFGLVLTVSAGIVNVVLDYIFMVPLQMGILGSALGTAIGYILPSIIGIGFFLNKNHPLSFEKPVMDYSVLTKTCWNGSSEMVSQSSAAITTFFFNITMMRLLGEQGVAAITILIYSQFLLTSVYIGFSMGTAPILSYQYGAQNRLKLKQIFQHSIKIILWSSLGIWVLALLFHDTLIQLFVATKSQVYAITKEGFFIFSFSFLCSGMNIYASAMFTALSNGKLSALLSFSRTFFFLLLCLLTLPLWLNVTGVWLAVPLAETCTVILSILCIWKQKSTYGYL